MSDCCLDRGFAIKIAQRVWGLDEAGIEEHLRELGGNGRLRAFIERFRDLWPTLPADRDVPFWRALARSLVRQQDWTRGQEPQKPVADDLEALLRSFANERPDALERAKAIVDALLADKDLIIAPAVLRSHLFRYGMVGDRSERSDIPVIFSREELEALLPGETRRYYEAIRSGYYLRRIPDADAMYFLMNLGEYDAALREDMTKQLDGPEPIKTLAALLVPPGYLIEPSALDQLINMEQVSAVLEPQFEAGLLDQDDPWLQSAISRLRRVLRRQDPHFD